MKYLIAALVLVSTAVFGADKAPEPTPAASAPKYKEVCKETKDKGKVCKKIRVHKKLEGKPVPDKK